MRVGQFIADLDELADLMRERFRKNKVIYGHSWGSAMGPLYTARASWTRFQHMLVRDR